jgi:hypothetical protein
VKQWPRKLRKRGRVLARIYPKTEKCDCFQVYWRVRENGKAKSRSKSFLTYHEAKRYGDQLVKDLARGSQVSALSAGQANDALIALNALAEHYKATGRRLTLAGAVGGFARADAKLDGRSLDEASERMAGSGINLLDENISYEQAQQLRKMAHPVPFPDLDFSLWRANKVKSEPIAAHSERRAIIGSTRAARQPGIRQAAALTTDSVTRTPANVSRSNGLTP